MIYLFEISANSSSGVSCDRTDLFGNILLDKRMIFIYFLPQYEFYEVDDEST